MARIASRRKGAAGVKVFVERYRLLQESSSVVSAEQWKADIMTPVAGRPSRRLRGRDEMVLVDVTCVCATRYDVPLEFIDVAICPSCGVSTLTVPPADDDDRE